jgi:hypothetical protein
LPFCTSFLVNKYLTAAIASVVKSNVVEELKLPVDLPIPLSSNLKTAIPLRVR